MIGIYDCFGYGEGYDIPFAARYKLIKHAGFDCVMLWWSDMFGRGDGYQEDVRLARDAGLQIENIHAPVHEQNSLSADDLHGDSVFSAYLQCVKDCQQHGISTVVIHLHDNGGVRNQHQLPFEGMIDWSDVMQKIAHTGYRGATTLEPMNWDYAHLSIHEFLDLAYVRAKRLDALRIS